MSTKSKCALILQKRHAKSRSIGLRGVARLATGDWRLATGPGLPRLSRQNRCQSRHSSSANGTPCDLTMIRDVFNPAHTAIRVAAMDD